MYKLFRQPRLRGVLLWSGLILAATLLFSWFFVGAFVDYGESLERNALLVAASTAAASFDASEVATLKGSPDDAGTDAFRQVQEGLQQMRTVIPESRFAYLLALRDGELIFLADAEPEESPDHSSPGSVYAEGSAVLRQVFTSRVAATEGPIADRWGTWVSGLAPVIDQTSGEVIAVFGVDISAGRWHATAAQFRWLGLIVGAFLTGVVLVFSLLMYRQHRLGVHLTAANRIVENSMTFLYRVAATPSLPLTFISRNVAKLGYEPEEFLTSPVFYRSLIHPDDLPSVESFERGLLENSASTTIQFRIRAKSGLYHWVENRVTPVRDERGKLLAAEGLLLDVTERRLADEKVLLANTLLTTTMETSPDGILVVGKDNRIVSFNRRFCAMWGIDRDAIVAGDDGPVLDAVMAKMKDPGAFAERVQYLYAHRQEFGQEELETADGRFIERHTSPLQTDSGLYFGRVWYFRDISARRRAEAEIRHTAHHDVLTGLANRRTFMAEVERAMARVGRGERNFAVFYLDLDHFKDVNDTLGHPLGDALLCAVADRLRLAARETDLVARFGGDEFAVIAAALDEPSDAADFAERLITALRAPYAIQGNDICCGASIGIAVYEPDDPDSETLLAHADVALYRAKAEGRGGYQFFTGAMESDVRTRVTMIAELRAAIASEQLFLEYQPQVDVETGSIVGLEALVRWRHPTRGPLAPEIFIPVAEKSGLITTLERWVMLEACKQGKIWFDAGVAPALVSVNVSGMRFKMALDLERDIAAALASSGLPPDRLELELTESVFMVASREHTDVVSRLRQSGITFAIDDFGTGFSSLDYLRRFPGARVKIAQDFVQKISFDPGSAAIVRATIGLAREMGMVSIAEGVETQEQLALLKAWGCLQVQGYYYSKPLEPGALLPLLLRRKILEPVVPVAQTAA